MKGLIMGIRNFTIYNPYTGKKQVAGGGTTYYKAPEKKPVKPAFTQDYRRPSDSKETAQVTQVKEEPIQTKSVREIRTPEQQGYKYTETPDAESKMTRKTLEVPMTFGTPGVLTTGVKVERSPASPVRQTSGVMDVATYDDKPNQPYATTLAEYEIARLEREKSSGNIIQKARTRQELDELKIKTFLDKRGAMRTTAKAAPLAFGIGLASGFVNIGSSLSRPVRTAKSTVTALKDPYGTGYALGEHIYTRPVQFAGEVTAYYATGKLAAKGVTALDRKIIGSRKYDVVGGTTRSTRLDKSGMLKSEVKGVNLKVRTKKRKRI